MKKHILPIVLTATVVVITYLFQTFTLIRQEELGLFLNTPDFYRALFFDPFPISNLIGSFLVQFYANRFVGIAIIALMVLLAFLLTRSIFRRIGFKFSELAACIVASAAWWFIARSKSPAAGSGILLGLTALWIISKFLHKRKVPEIKFWELAVSLVPIATIVVLILTNPEIKATEKWGKIEYAAVQNNWNYLLKIATPKEAKKDVDVIPFALLALNAQGRLADEMTDYPLGKDFGLDFADEVSYRRSLFDAVLYDALGCPNEAVHRWHQSGDFLPHCTSFRTLRQLVKTNYELGDSLMVVKYCDILARSTSHKEFVQWYRSHPCTQRDTNTAQERSNAVLMQKNDPRENMLQLGRAGIESPMAMERYYCYFQLDNYFKERKQ